MAADLGGARLSIRGSAHERGPALEDEAYRRLNQKIAQAALVGESFEERTILHLLEQFGGDASPDVHTTDRENFECQVAGFRTVGRNENIQSLNAEFAGARLAQLADDGVGSSWRMRSFNQAGSSRPLTSRQ